MITLKNISKSFGHIKVLKDINFQFEEGKTYGIVGENGAGKTTLFKCITGLEKCTGSVKSNLVPIKNYLGYLETEPFFFEKMTGREYIQMLCNARDIKKNDFEAKNIFDLPLNQYAETYSTGMKKKLALTAILLQQNDCFILDEPFNGVDIQSNLIIIEIIKELKKLNKTILISSHIFSTLSDCCDEIILLSEGVFSKVVKPDQFGDFENEMNKRTIGNSISKLELS